MDVVGGIQNRLPAAHADAQPAQGLTLGHTGGQFGIIGQIGALADRVGIVPVSAPGGLIQTVAGVPASRDACAH